MRRPRGCFSIGMKLERIPNGSGVPSGMRSSLYRMTA